jgi:hypothetical protein
MRSYTFSGALAVMALACLGSAAAAHELTEARATLVRRDANHVALTLTVDCAEVMHHILAPEAPPQAFVMMLSALAPEAFQASFKTAQAAVQAEVQAQSVGSGERLNFVHWVWPEASAVQQSVRERVMQSLVNAKGDHAHDAPQQIRAEAQAAKPITALRVRFPAALGRVLVVSYSPKQAWAEPKSASTEIGF